MRRNLPNRRLTLLVCRSLAQAKHDVASLPAALDVADRLDDLVELVGPVDHGPVLARVDEFLDQEQVLLAIAADSDGRTLATDDSSNESQKRHVIHEPEVHRDVESAGFQRAPAAPER